MPSGHLCYYALMPDPESRPVGRPSKLTQEFIAAAYQVINQEDNALIFTDEELLFAINEKLSKEAQIFKRTFEKWKAGDVSDDVEGQEFLRLVLLALQKQKKAIFTSLKLDEKAWQGEQSETSLDRIKLSVQKLSQRWQVEDREFNAATVRAYRYHELFREIFKFSLAPTTSNESKTLNVLIVDEAHLADDTKRSNELDPMLSSTGGVTFFIGAGCTRLGDFCRPRLRESRRRDGRLLRAVHPGNDYDCQSSLRDESCTRPG